MSGSTVCVCVSFLPFLPFSFSSLFPSSLLSLPSLYSLSLPSIAPSFLLNSHDNEQHTHTHTHTHTRFKLCTTSERRWSVTWSSGKVRSSTSWRGLRPRTTGGRGGLTTEWGSSLLIMSNYYDFCTIHTAVRISNYGALMHFFRECWPPSITSVPLQFQHVIEPHFIVSSLMHQPIYWYMVDD